jgi:3-hydroxyisobutyrate dehydrogenase-like beta-hydroxyacid dehydrogenase
VKTPVSVLGTGRMGAALASAFIKNGHPTTVWNRTLERTVPLRAAGATVAANVSRAIAASPITIVNVSDYGASGPLLREASAAGALQGKLIVELTSGTPQGARDAALWTTAQGALYLDGAILATPNLIGTEHGVILVAGPATSFDAHRETLQALGNVRHVGEDPGTASTLDSAALSQMWGALFGALHAIALCEAEKVDLAVLAKQWEEVKSVLDGLVTDLINRAEARRYAGDEQTLSSISAHHGALHHLIEITEQRQLDRTLVDGYDAIFKRAIAAGHLHDDFAAMARFMGKPA